MPFGSQLPAWSPVSVGSLVAGARAMLSPQASRRTVEELLRSTWPASAVLPCDSGTSALGLALRSVGHGTTGQAPRVALPAWGCYDLGTAARGAGVQVLPYDLVPETLGPDLASLRAALEQGATAVVVAHWYGIPADMPAVAALAAEYGALVVDDAAQGVGASIGSTQVGGFGDLGVLSFGRGKGRTGGGGGALLANSARGAELLESVRHLVRPARAGMREALALKAQWVLGRPALYWIPESLPFMRLGETVWHDPWLPEGLPAFAAGALVASWPRSTREVRARAVCASQWMLLRPGLTVPSSAAPNAVPGYLRLPVLARTTEERTRLLQVPGAMPGYPVILPQVPQLQGTIIGDGPWPGANRLVQDLVTLPCHHWVRPSA